MRKPLIWTISFFISIFFVSGPDLLAQTPLPDTPAIEKRVDSMLHKLTLEQKIELLGGVSTWYTHAEPSIGLPPLRLSDGPAGMRSGIPAVAYPAPIGLAATWDTELVKKVGTSIGYDARARGVDFLLGPAVNIIRAPMDGRDFEYMSEDPYLTSRIAVAYIRGVQSQGVSATVKHFMMNNQEYNRHDASSDADERTMREIYLPAFEAAVKEAHVGAIMDSYNLVNGTHSTQNGWMNNQVAKHDWGFKGIIMSDWVAVYDGVAAANNGLDLEMPFGRYMAPNVLLPAIKAGQVSEATIDDKVRRILRVALLFGFAKRPQETLPWYSQQGDRIALDAARESFVLLKNDHGVLPLDAKKTCTLGVIGPNAWPAVIGGGGSAAVEAFKSVSMLVGISDYLTAHAAPSADCAHRVLYDSGLPSRYEIFKDTKFEGGLKQQTFASRDWSGAPIAETVRPTLNEDRIVVPRNGSLRWIGDYIATQPGRYYVVVHDGRTADRHRVFVDGEELPSPKNTLEDDAYFFPIPQSLSRGQKIRIRLDYLPGDTEVFPGLGVIFAGNLLSERARKIAQTADAVVIAAGFDKSTEHEGADRTFSLPPLQDDLISALAPLNKRTILTITSGGNVDMNAWYDRIPTILQLWYPGEEGGVAIAETLFGENNPSGKLPVSYEYRWKDNPTYKSYYPTSGANTAEPHIRYTEGVFLGYRYYTTFHMKPRFPFGYGLSYTSFSFSHLQLSDSKIAPGDPLTATFDVTNTGKVRGSEVAELYVGDPSAKVKRPAVELKGFAKVRLNPGETKRISITLNRRSFAYWSEKKNAWQVDPGVFVIYVGDSSANLPLRADFAMK